MKSGKSSPTLQSRKNLSSVKSSQKFNKSKASGKQNGENKVDRSRNMFNLESSRKKMETVEPVLVNRDITGFTINNNDQCSSTNIEVSRSAEQANASHIKIKNE